VKKWKLANEMFLIQRVRSYFEVLVKLGGVMKRNHKKDSGHAVRMELKYCEHCGSLWMRVTGTEAVYCENCQPKVAELPPPQKKNPGRLQLPVAKTALVERYEGDAEELLEMDLDELEFEAAGGVA
jgi:hypothetical protein